MAEWTEELDSMSKPLRGFDAAHKEMKAARIVLLETTEVEGARPRTITLEITTKSGAQGWNSVDLAGSSMLA